MPSSLPLFLHVLTLSLGITIPFRFPRAQLQGLSPLALPEMQRWWQSASPQESPQTLYLRHIMDLTGGSILSLLESLDGPSPCIDTVPSPLLMLSCRHCGCSALPIDNLRWQRSSWQGYVRFKCYSFTECGLLFHDNSMDSRIKVFLLLSHHLNHKRKGLSNDGILPHQRPPRCRKPVLLYPRLS